MNMGEASAGNLLTYLVLCMTFPGHLFAATHYKEIKTAAWYGQSIYNIVVVLSFSGIFEEKRKKNKKR